MPKAYYNENDPKAAAWIRALIEAGLIMDGVVDERSIVDVSPDDLAGFTRCHFFAGIAGWDYALQLAGWPEDRPVWTGSCPCQPFSSAGKNLGTADSRHLWPEFCRLIAQRGPATVFGEQVDSKAGRAWLAGVRADLEALGNAVGCACLCGSIANLPERPRLFWVANANSDRERGLSVNAKASCLSASSRRSVHEWANARGMVQGRNGLPKRVGRRRGYGNAIQPDVAAEFIAAFMETESLTFEPEMREVQLSQFELNNE